MDLFRVFKVTTEVPYKDPGPSDWFPSATYKVHIVVAKDAMLAAKKVVSQETIGTVVKVEHLYNIDLLDVANGA